MESPRKIRNRAACRRCQRRKIRCDGNEPSCGSCQKAGVACVNDGKQEVTRRYISNMENRIRWLEAIVKENCSHIDLRCKTQADASDDTRPGPTDDSFHYPVQTISNGSQQEEEPRLEEQLPSMSEQHTSNPPSGQQQAHEVGLVSLSSGGGARYIGPSSGYFFANRIFSSAGRCRRERGTTRSNAQSAYLSAELLNNLTLLPTRKESAMELSAKYFQTVHLTYPFLHEPSHRAIIDRVYASQEENPLDRFQVYLVLAIAALNLSRQCKVHLPVEGYYASAMRYAENVCTDGSMAALQCLLLLMVYALHNPSCNVNIWNLNYQCLASVIDLGLQRDVRASSSLQISVLEQEMRTRVFWVAYTFDRAICTMMGRPIGVRDEACEMRFPLDISDHNLVHPDAAQHLAESPSPMSHSIHLFKLAKMNSEIKYIMHSIQRGVPAYAYPPIKDIFSWQRDMVDSLQTWLFEIPQTRNCDDAMAQLCKAKYHETMILLLRPSPAIPDPTEEILDLCFHQAVDLLQEFGGMYRSGSLLYSRLLVHSVFLGALVLLYCIWKLPRTTATVRVDELISNLGVAQNILSSIGEYWAEATRARDCIDELSNVTMQRLLRNQSSATTVHTADANRRSSRSGPIQNAELVHIRHLQELYPSPNQDSSERLVNTNSDCLPLVPMQGDMAGTVEDQMNLFDDLLQGDFQGWSGMSDIDGLMWELFNTLPQ